MMLAQFSVRVAGDGLPLLVEERNRAPLRSGRFPCSRADQELSATTLARCAGLLCSRLVFTPCMLAVRPKQTKLKME